MLVFPVLALVYVYLLGRWLVSGLVGMLAVIFFSVDPTLLGNGFWIGTDTASAAGYLAATYYGLRWIQQPTWRSDAAAGVAVGLAIATKFSCLAIVPALGIVALLNYLKRDKEKRRALVRQFLPVGAGGVGDDLGDLSFQRGAAGGSGCDWASAVVGEFAALVSLDADSDAEFLAGDCAGGGAQRGGARGLSEWAVQPGWMVVLLSGVAGFEKSGGV